MAAKIPINPEYPDCYNYGRRIFDIRYLVLINQMELNTVPLKKRFHKILDPFEQPLSVEGKANIRKDSDGYTYFQKGVDADTILKIANNEYMDPHDVYSKKVSQQELKFMHFCIGDLAEIYQRYQRLRFVETKDVITIRNDITLYLNAVAEEMEHGVYYEAPPEEDLAMLTFLRDSMTDLADTIEFYTKDKRSLGTMASIFAGKGTPTRLVSQVKEERRQKATRPKASPIQSMFGMNQLLEKKSTPSPTGEQTIKGALKLRTPLREEERPDMTDSEAFLDRLKGL